MQELFGRPSEGTWKRYAAAKVKTRKGKRLRQRDIPTTEDGAWYAQLFVEEHADLDLYFTPALFKHMKDGKRTVTQVAWVSWIWVDVDGVPGARTGGEAWARLADTLDDLKIPQPNLVFCTSEKPEDLEYQPRLQCYWRIADLEVGSSDGRRRLWRKTAGKLADRLIAAGFLVDRGASTNIAGLMRLPGSLHTKTGTRVEQVGPSHDSCYTLSELLESLEASRPLERAAKARPRRPRKRGGKRGKLSELPQMSALAQGVKEGVRNLALYGLAKALWADGVSLEEAIEWALAWNEQCDPPENPEKIRDVVCRAYGAYGPQANPVNFTGIDPDITAAVVSEVVGEPVEPDPRLRTWFPHPKERQAQWQPTPSHHRINGEPIQKQRDRQRRRRGRRRNTPPRWLIIGEACRELVKELAKTGRTLTLEAIAASAQVSKRTVERYSDKIINYLKHQTDMEIIRTSQGFYIWKLTNTENPYSRSEPTQKEAPPTITWGSGGDLARCGVSRDGRAPPSSRERPSAPELAAFVAQVRAELLAKGLPLEVVAAQVERTRALLYRLYGEIGGNGTAEGYQEMAADSREQEDP